MSANINEFPIIPTFTKIESKQVIAPEFKPEYFPSTLATFICDEAGRMSTTPDGIAAGLVVALGTIAGGKFRMKPKLFDNWLVVPNLYGAILGNPSTKKSALMSIALRILKEIEKNEKAKYRKALAQYKIDSELFGMKHSADKRKAKKLLDDGATLEDAKAALKLDDEIPEEPIERVLICNDTTVEALGIELAGNPYGVLMESDELTGFIKNMDKPGREGDRAFYLTAWNGNSSYDVRRISRDNLLIPNVCVSVFGGIQPDKIKPLIKGATSGGESNDGFIQRIQVMVYPEPVKSVWVDRAPMKGAYDAVSDAFNRIHQIEPESPDEPIVLGFDDDAQQLFIQWYEQNSAETEPGKLPTHLEAHFSKYPKLVTSLALIFHLVETNNLESIGIESLTKALAYSEYLKGHAKKIYALAESVDEENAVSIAKKFGSKLVSEFTVRDVVRGNWKGIGKSKERALEAIEILVSHGYVTELIDSPNYGKATTSYLINPDVVGVHS